jgi:hypothetical protein
MHRSSQSIIDAMIDAMIDALGQIAAPSRSVEIDPSRPYHNRAESYCVITSFIPSSSEELAQQASRRTRPGIGTGASWFETALTRLLTMRDY